MTYIHDNLQKLERFLRQVKQNTEHSYQLLNVKLEMKGRAKSQCLKR